MRKIVLTILMMLAVACSVQAYPDKDFYSSGQINDGEHWSNVNIYGDDTIVDMFFDAWVGNLTTHNKSIFNVYGGSVDFLLTCSDNSFVDIIDGDFGTITAEEFGNVDIYSGNINALSASGGSIYLYAYDVTHDPTGGFFGEGELVGRYFKDDTLFVYDLHEGAYSHITVVPEPATFLLVGLGGVLLRKRK